MKFHAISCYCFCLTDCFVCAQNVRIPDTLPEASVEGQQKGENAGRATAAKAK